MGMTVKRLVVEMVKGCYLWKEIERGSGVVACYRVVFGVVLGCC